MSGELLVGGARVCRARQSSRRGVLGGGLRHQQSGLEGADARVRAARQRRTLANAVEHRAANAVVRKSTKRHAPRVIEATGRLEQALLAHRAQVVELDRAPDLARDLVRDEVHEVQMRMESLED